MKKIIIICFAALVLVSCTSIQTKKNSQTGLSNQLSNQEKTVALLNSLETGDPKPVGYINPDKYIQHNLMVEIIISSRIRPSLTEYQALVKPLNPWLNMESKWFTPKTT